jgi:hypothetical protein
MLLDRVLDAAEAVVVRQGIGNLTLEAVAAEAKISKGGLLYHSATASRTRETGRSGSGTARPPSSRPSPRTRR